MSIRLRVRVVEGFGGLDQTLGFAEYSKAVQTFNQMHDLLKKEGSKVNVSKVGEIKEDKSQLKGAGTTNETRQFEIKLAVPTTDPQGKQTTLELSDPVTVYFLVNRKDDNPDENGTDGFELIYKGQHHKFEPNAKALEAKIQEIIQLAKKPS